MGAIAKLLGLNGKREERAATQKAQHEEGECLKHALEETMAGIQEAKHELQHQLDKAPRAQAALDAAADAVKLAARRIERKKEQQR